MICILIKGLKITVTYYALYFPLFFPVYLQYILTSIRQLFHNISVSNMPHTYILFLSLSVPLSLWGLSCFLFNWENKKKQNWTSILFHYIVNLPTFVPIVSMFPHLSLTAPECNGHMHVIMASMPLIQLWSTLLFVISIVLNKNENTSKYLVLKKKKNTFLAPITLPNYSPILC